MLRRNVWFLCALMTAGLTFVLGLGDLLSSTHAFGADGYYYAAQMKHLHERGTFFAPDYSLVLLYLLGFSLFTNDYVFSNKIAVALLSAALAWPAYVTGRNFGRFPAAGAVFAAFVCSNSFAIYFAFEFIKNLAGIFWFLFFLAMLPRLMYADVHRATLFATALAIVKRAWPAAIFALLSLITHKLTGGLALLLLVASVMYVMRKDLRFLALALLAVPLALGLLLLLAPGILSVADFARFEGLLAPPQFAPLSFVRLMHPPQPQFAEALCFGVLPLCAAGLGVFQVYRRRAWADGPGLLTLILYVLVIFPFLRFDSLGFAFRLYLLIFVPAGLALVWFLREYFGEDAGRRAVYLVVAVAALLLFQLYARANFQHPSNIRYDVYARFVDNLDLPDDSILIAHQGLDNFYYYRTGKDAFRFVPEARHSSRPLYRLAHGVPKRVYEHFIAGADVRYLPAFYAVLKEEDWQRLLQALPPEVSAAYLRNWRNVSQQRPVFLRD